MGIRDPWIRGGGPSRKACRLSKGRAVGGGRRAVGYLGMAPGTMECPERELESRRVHCGTATGRGHCRYLVEDSLALGRGPWTPGRVPRSTGGSMEFNVHESTSPQPRVEGKMLQVIAVSWST